MSEIAYELRQTRDQLAQFQTTLQTHYKPALEELQREVANLQRTNSAAPPTGGGLLQSIESVPGARMPQWYTAEHTFVVGSTASGFASVEVSPEGPFIITQVGAAWRCTDPAIGMANITGRLLPLSAFRNFGQALNPATGAVLASGANLLNMPEFSLRFEVEGSGRFLCNIDMPAHLVDYMDHPKYTGCLGWVDGSNRLKVIMNPEIATPHVGKVIVTFIGYQILNPIKLGDVLAGRYAA